MPNPLYFAECNYGRLGVEFQPTDRDDNSRDAIIRQIRNGGIDVIKVLEIDEDAGTCRDVTDELIAEAAQPREPRSFEEIRKLLIDYQNDHQRDLLKHEGVFGW